MTNEERQLEIIKAIAGGLLALGFVTAIVAAWFNS